MRRAAWRRAIRGTQGKQQHEHMIHNSHGEIARPVLRPVGQAAGRPADTAPLIVS